MFTARRQHLVYVLAGVALAGLFCGLTSFDNQGGPPSDHTRRISLDPDPNSIVRIVEGQPYMVPRGQILVVKSIGDANSNGIVSARMLVDGAAVLGARLDLGTVTLGFPVTAAAGEVVTVEDTYGADPNTLIVVGGYLANERGR